MRLLNVRSRFLLTNAPDIEVFSWCVLKSYSFRIVASYSPNRRSHEVQRMSARGDRFRASRRRGRLTASPAQPSITTEKSGRSRIRRDISPSQVAERQGFEPWDPVKGQRFSRPPRSTTPAPLREGSGGAHRTRPKGAQPDFRRKMTSARLPLGKVLGSPPRQE